MKDRFTKLGTSMLGALCLLSTCGLVSCHDDYDLPNKRPSFLGESIYDELKSRSDKKFTTTLRLVNDLNYQDVLAKTGSLTLFVADDDAYQHFFATTDWKDGAGNPIRSYEQLSINQKRMLFNNAMLNNPYLLEMMTNTENNGKYLCLRQGTAVSRFDSVPRWSVTMLPQHLSEKNLEEPDAPENKDLWKYARMQDTLYMAIDNTAPLMTHFLEGQLNNKQIKNADVAFLLNKPDNWWPENSGKRSFIYNREVKEADVTCTNGYYHVLDSVLVTPPNMAEVIRTNGQTNLFSLLLERFSVPVYDAHFTALYQTAHPSFNKDIPVFSKAYISSNPVLPSKLQIDKDSIVDITSFPALNYNPGWNAYAVSKSIDKQRDMAAMFVPTDKAMEDYFLVGAGKVLMRRYALKPNTKENLPYNLSQIPLEVIQALLNNLMKESFNETVPSKYLTIMNDAQDQMFEAKNYPTVAEYKKLFDKVLLANNGVVYVMNKVISPADYAAVSAPVLLSKDTRIFRSVVRADEPYIETGYNNAPLKQYFSTYLKAMQSHFSFFAPTDEALGKYGYVDPSTIVKGVKNSYRYWRFTYELPKIAMTRGQQYLPIRMDAYKYNMETGPRDDDAAERAKSLPHELLNTSTFGPQKRALLTEMVNQHMVIHDDTQAAGMNSDRVYYTSREGAPIIRVKKGDRSRDDLGMEVVGGYQLDLNHDNYPDNNATSKVIQAYDMTNESNGYGNGMTYFIDRALQPTMKSVHDVLSTTDAFKEFYALCDPEKFSDDIFLEAGLKDSIKSEDSWQTELNKYRIFIKENPKNGGGNYLVRFLNNYRYSIYIPTNEQVKAAIAKGLPTWESIKAFEQDPSNRGDFKDEKGKVVNRLTDEAKIKAQAMITCLTNFVKYHFQDQVYYLDNANNGRGDQCQTACFDDVNQSNVYLFVKQSNGAIELTDHTGAKSHVDRNNCNILVREMHFNKTVGAANTSSVIINSSSYAAIHQVDKVLNFLTASEFNGRFDSRWKTATIAKNFVRKYRIKE